MNKLNSLPATQNVAAVRMHSESESIRSDMLRQTITIVGRDRSINLHLLLERNFLTEKKIQVDIESTLCGSNLKKSQNMGCPGISAVRRKFYPNLHDQ